MIMAGDKIRIHVFNDPEHLHEIFTANYGKTLEVYEKSGVPGYGTDNALGVDWIREDGETIFAPLDDFGDVLVTMYRVNPLPIDLELDEFAKLYAPPEGEAIDKTEKLRRALARAKHRALVISEDDDDGGTCNFDAPALDFAACGMKCKDAMQLIKSAGLHCCIWKPFKNHRNEDGTMTKAPSYLVINGFQRGQGNLRSRMAEAFCESMNADGCESLMYYQMD